MNYLALDIGGSSIKYGILNESGEILHKGKAATSKESLEDLMKAIAAVRDSIEESYEGVAVSMPGRIETKTGIAWTGGAYTFLKGTRIGKELQTVFNRRVTVANDGKCAAAAELWKGSLRDVSNGAVIVIGSGIGGGIILNHDIYMGSSSAAGEFSWIPVDYPGTWQPLDLRTESFRTIWSGWASATALILNYAKATGRDFRKIDGEVFFREYAEGSKEAEKVLQKFADDTAAGIYGLQAVLDLEKYAIGGGISAQPAVTEKIRDSVSRLWKIRHQSPFRQPEIVTAEYRNDANLIGALYFCLKQNQERR